jgi:hypothetical protein
MPVGSSAIRRRPQIHFHFTAGATGVVACRPAIGQIASAPRVPVAIRTATMTTGDFIVT